MLKLSEITVDFEYLCPVMACICLDEFGNQGVANLFHFQLLDLDGCSVPVFYLSFRFNREVRNALWELCVTAFSLIH